MNVRVTFPGGVKPHESASKDESRPHLTGVWIDGTTAIVSDSYQLASIPVEVDTYGGPALDAPLWLPAEVVKDVTRSKRGGSVEVTDKHYEPLTADGAMKDYVFRRSETHSAYRIPPHGKLWPEQKETFEVGLNPDLLFALAKAIGGYKMGVALSFSVANLKAGQNKEPIVVRPLGGDAEGRRGLLMPVRLNV